MPPGGGQNPLEPARLGCAIAVGPHTGNFTDHVAMLRAAGALTVVRDAAELARWVDAMLRDPARRRQWRDGRGGALQRHGDLPRTHRRRACSTWPALRCRDAAGLLAPRRRALPARCCRRSPPSTAAVTARRVARPGWRAPVPVICCGNVTVGGAGKTTLALDLGAAPDRAGPRRALPAARLWRRRARPAPRRAGDTAAQVGDEALLLAAVAPTWIGADRAASARAAVAAGAQVLVLDDGLQNPDPAQGPVAAGGGRRRPASATAACCRPARCASRWRPAPRAARRRC